MLYIRRTAFKKGMQETISQQINRYICLSVKKQNYTNYKMIY